MRETKTSFVDYIKFYQEQWRDVMGSYDTAEAPLQEYANESVGTTWMISYRAIQQKDNAAANLMLLWACLDNKDLWFELLTPAYRKFGTDEFIPEWFRSVASSKLAFTQTVKLLLNYSLVEGTEGLSSYAIHPVVHEWAWHMLEEEGRAEYCWLATIITGEAVPDYSEKEFWILQRRLLPHADRCVVCDLAGINNNYDKQRKSKANILALDARHILGLLYADQGKLDEAEKMYQRALQGYEKALGTEHTSTLNTVNNLGNLYADQGKLDEAEKMYQRALQGYEKALGPELLTTYIPASNTFCNLGSLFATQRQVDRSRMMFSKALVGYQIVFGHNHGNCQVVRAKLNALNTSTGETNLSIDIEANRAHESITRRTTLETPRK